ncbi:MAG: glycosyltransferase family 25 protein [Bradyrhizobiaceae bacterium]|nr:glycosyltransferase family 25 protein [Bradyrhizobiaceae bacterium]
MTTVSVIVPTHNRPEFLAEALAQGQHRKIPVRVINLKECHERREHMKREMADARISFTFIEAISKNAVKDSATLTRNQIACAMSHLHAIRLIAEGEDEWGAIFEDDVFASTEARQFLELETLRALPRFDILQLFGSTTRAALTVPLGHFRDHAIVARTRPYTGTQALIYRREAAQRIVRTITKISASIDEMLFNHCVVFGLRVASVQPAPIRHGDFPSTVFCPGPRLKAQQKIWRELRRGTNCIRRSASLIAAWSQIWLFRWAMRAYAPRWLRLPRKFYVTAMQGGFAEPRFLVIIGLGLLLVSVCWKILR